MKSFRAFSDSAYLKKEDFPEPEILTIGEVREEEVTPPGGKPKKKLVIYFEEIEKGLVLNMTNGEALLRLTGSEYPDKWIGTRVEAYNDPSVMYGGKAEGGIRLRKAPTPTPQPAEEPEEIEVPY